MYWIGELVYVLVFLAGAVFAVYGLVAFIRKRLQKSGLQDTPEEPDHEEEAPPHGSGLPPRDGAVSAAPGAKATAKTSAAQTARVSSKSLPTRRGRGAGAVMDKLFIRCLVVAGITLGLLIPLVFVSDLVDERASMRRGAINNIAGKWGGSQSVNGPALVIPYIRAYMVTDTVTDENGKNIPVKREAYAQEYRVVLPSDLGYTAKLAPQKRSYGIYDYVVYTTQIAVEGIFRLPPAEVFGEDAHRIEWEKAWFAIGIADLRAITGVDALNWNGGETAPYAPGTGLGELLGPGFHSDVRLNAANDPGQERAFSLQLNLNGSGGLHFTPVGETTRIDIAGDWPHPSFSGSLLPKTRTITTTDFKASWVIPHLSRTYPQSEVFGQGDFKAASNRITGFRAGVDLFETVSLYTQVDRAVKYAILFIGLTFVALLAFELAAKARLHLMQYGLVGIAMTLFYLALLSLAEHTSFILAFGAASLISIAMNGLYITAAFKSTAKGLVVTGLLAALYLLLYALLQMEEYALLMGTGMVIVVVGVLMYLTRNLPAQGRGTAQQQP